jgi:hypothetical protein
MVRLEDWQVQHRGGAVQVCGWFRTAGGDRIRVSSGRVIATRIGIDGREVMSRGGVGPLEYCMREGTIARDGLGHEFFLAGSKWAA